MAGGREIKTKIKSVQNTRKVTRALEMVSASKIRKAQERMKGSRPYARLMTQLIGHIAKANSEYTHPFMADHGQIKRVGYIIVSTDRGLCGGLNSGMFRRLLIDMRQWQEKGVGVELVCIGQVGTVVRPIVDPIPVEVVVTHIPEPILVLVALARPRGVSVIINDRADIAAQSTRDVGNNVMHVRIAFHGQ